jgi:hypothetical protein
VLVVTYVELAGQFVTVLGQAVTVIKVVVRTVDVTSCLSLSVFVPNSSLPLMLYVCNLPTHSNLKSRSRLRQ